MAAPLPSIECYPLDSEIPPELAISRPIEQREYLIGGELKIWPGKLQEVASPISRREGGTLSKRVLGSYPLLDSPAAIQALEAAELAYGQGRGAWPTMPVAERIRHMEDFTFRMQAKRDEVVKLLMWEVGKRRDESEKEFDRTVAYIRDTIEALRTLDRASSRLEIQQGIIGQIRRSPLGVVLCMGPFNYPLNETFTTLIPALIMGNTVIFKPPKLGVLLHRPLLEAFRDSFPPGVVNTVYGGGKETITPLLSSGKVDVLAFIGSSRVAGILKKLHPRPYRLRSVLGLEAKNPGIILPDADLDLAIKECLLGTLSFNGQRCTALKILFVHRSLADEFVERFSEAVSALRCGAPWDPDAEITPLPEEGKAAYMQGQIQDACERGARIVNRDGGSVHDTLFKPAVLYPVAPGARLYTEEQFGPIVPIVPYDEIEEPIRYMAESNYGQQASIFGRDPRRIAELVDPLVNQVCRLNINSQCQRGPDTYPFTGRKDSAEGTLSVSDALRVFSIRALVATKASDQNKQILSSILQGRFSNFLSTDFLL